MNTSHNLPTLFATALLLITLTPFLVFITPQLSLPTLRTLVPLFDHLAGAFFAARYLTFSTGLLPTDPNTLYPYILPYLPLLQLAYQFLTTNSVAEVILPFSHAPKPEYNPCQARFSIFMSSVLGIPLIILQAVYGVPMGISHYVTLVLPSLLIVFREGASWTTFILLALIAWLGNVAVLGYLVCAAVHALLSEVSLARLLLAPRDHCPVDNLVSGEEPLLGKTVDTDTME